MISKLDIRKVGLTLPLVVGLFVMTGTEACQKDYDFAKQSNVTGTPSPNETASGTPTGTASATPSGTASPSGSPTPTPNGTVSTTPSPDGTASPDPTDDPDDDSDDDTDDDGADPDTSSVFTPGLLRSALEEVRDDAKKGAAERGASNTNEALKQGNWLGAAYANKETVPGVSPDSDGDGYTDLLEADFGTSISDKTDTPPTPVTRLRDRLGQTDSDYDGLTADQENRAGTSSSVSDTDGDGSADGAEVLSGTDPIDKDAKPQDTDGDGLSDAVEQEMGSDFRRVDSDRDLLRDDEEVSIGSNLFLADSDHDGILDGTEVELGGDPVIPES
jgi:hypothetical protein